MHPTHRPTRKRFCDSSRCHRRVAGFTLVEVMLAACVLVGAGFGIYACLLKAYQVVAVGRYRDAARAVLQTYADQFERLQTADTSGTGTNSVACTRWFFKPTVRPTATGLLWDGTVAAGGLNMNLNKLCTEPDTPGAPAPANSGLSPDYLRVNLGGSNNASSTSSTTSGSSQGIEAHVTREVWGLYDDGRIISGQGIQYESAGELLLGRFTITYTVFNQPFTLNLAVLRAAQAAQ